MTEKEKLQRKRALTQEIYQLDMKIMDFKLGDADRPMDLARYEARAAELRAEVQGLDT